MATQKLKFDEAHEYVRSKRGIIRPNFGFIEQLKQFEKELFPL